jgi:hypothetical protein
MAHFLRPLSLLVLAPLLSLLSLPACEGGGDTGGGGDSGGGGSTGTQMQAGRPQDPAQNDTTFAVKDMPRYLLVGDALTPDVESFVVRVTPPAGVTAIDLWLDDAEEPLALAQDGADFTVEVDAKALSIGEHTALLAEHGAEMGFFKGDFSRGHALYVIVSTDWDFPDVSDVVLAHHEELHTLHPELLITHLIGPYTFTDPAIPQARRDEIVAWAKGMRDTHGDEIGLHVHPWCNFVEAAGLTCQTQPSVVYPAGDDTGYSVRLGAYTREEWNTLFAKAADIWQSVGFGKATSFRAGAWTLETHVAEALADSGFVVDSSPVNWPYMEEWEGYDLYTWSEQQWGPIGDTSQPYHATADSILPGGSGAPIPLLLVPDNGVMVDYWTVAEMQAIFDANWDRKGLPAPIQVSTGFHPAPAEYYNSAEYDRLDAFFTYTDQFLASEKAGPVVYMKMSDAPVVWK